MGGETTKRICILIFMMVTIFCGPIFSNKVFAAELTVKYVDLTERVSGNYFRVSGTGNFKLIRAYTRSGTFVNIHTGGGPFPSSLQVMSDYRYIEVTYDATTSSLGGVVAYDSTGSRAVASYTSIVDPFAAPNAPTVLGMTPAVEKVTLSWVSVPAATRYKLYLDGVEVGTTTATSYVFNLSEIKSYVFSVSALNSYGESSKASATGRPNPPPNPDTIKFVIEGMAFAARPPSDGLLTWDSVNSSYLKNYKVFKGTELIGSTATPSLTVTGLLPGETYNFRVIPVDRFDAEYGAGNLTYTYPLPDTTPPSVPVLSGVAGDKQVKLTWTESPESDLDSYSIYQDGIKVKSGIRANDAEINGLRNDQNYKFAVTSSDKTGNESGKSNEIILTPKAKPPPITEVEQKEEDGVLLVTWKATEGATGYRIYLNGSLVGTAPANVFEFKITRAMGYRPGALENRSEVKAVLADGSEGGSSNPGGGNLADMPFVLGNMIKVAFGWMGLFRNWIIVGLSIIFAAIVIDFLFYSMKRKRIKQLRGR